MDSLLYGLLWWLAMSAVTGLMWLKAAGDVTGPRIDAGRGWRERTYQKVGWNCGGVR